MEPQKESAMRESQGLDNQRDDPAEQVETAWCDAWRSLAYDPATKATATERGLRILTPSSPDQLLNAVLRLRMERPVTLADIKEQLAPFYAARRAAQWWLRLDVAPKGLREQLTTLGMRPWDRPPGMALALDSWNPPSTSAYVQAHPVNNRSEAEAALGVICDVFGANPGPMRHWSIDNPDFVVFLATINQQVAGALAYHLRDGIVGIFHVATAPRWRRQGVAWTMMIRALIHARNAGARAAALTSSTMAETLYRALGFQRCCQFEFWTPGPRLLMEMTGIV